MRFAVVAAAVCTLTVPAFAAFPPPHPELASPFALDKTLPELQTPAVVTMDANWLRSPLLSKGIEIKNIPLFHCDGAVIRLVEVRKLHSLGKTARMYFRFHVGLRKGDDRDITINYDLLDGERVVGSGRIDTWNLDEHTTTWFEGFMKLAQKDFDTLIADGGKPSFRVTMSIAEQP